MMISKGLVPYTITTVQEREEIEDADSREQFDIDLAEQRLLIDHGLYVDAAFKV